VHGTRATARRSIARSVRAAADGRAEGPGAVVPARCETNSTKRTISGPFVDFVPVRGAAGVAHTHCRATVQFNASAMAVSAPAAPAALSARGIVKSFGGRLVLDGLDLDLAARARVGLIGANGSGKSTLLKVLAGADEPDAGAVTLRRGAVVAHLSQMVIGDERTVRHTIRDARPDVAALEQELTRVEAQLGDPKLADDLDRMAKVLERHQRLLERREALGADRVEGDAIRHLRDLGVADRDLDRPTSALSGGQRKLVALAACLVLAPDVLLLDEPEAHLDVERRRVVEELVRDFDGAVLVVSHDRYLLDETVSQIAELEHGRIRMWPGNYSAYAVAREVELMRQQQQWVTQQKEIARLEEAIRRFKDWAHRVVDERHIKQARNKQRQIDRMEKVERPVFERRKMALELRSAARGGDRVIELRGVDFDPVLIDVDLTIMRGERVGIVGPNGAGKTVLARLLAGDLQPIEGERWAGPSIAVDLLTQTAEELPRDKTPIELVRQAKPVSEGEAVGMLVKFLFDYEQLRRPVASMSGGERTRLRCLLLMLSRANCLVLDEPTNHLDIPAVETLEAALEGYDGTVIGVSHDRYFLDRIADRIVEVRDGEVRSYEGGFSAWEERARSLP
jgi:ATP-binding cassette subfamily F protein 3